MARSTAAPRSTEPALGGRPAARRSVSIDVPLDIGREDATEAVQRALQRIAPFVADRTVEREEAIHRDVLDRIIEATPMRALDARRAALEQRAVAAIFDGTEWLSAEQVGRLRDPAARNPHSAVGRWRAEGKVFGLPKGGALFYPRYAFDETLEPLPAVAQILEVFADLSPYRIASWFESTNGHLRGRRPRELLARDPQALLRAAHEHVRGPVHG